MDALVGPVMSAAQLLYGLVKKPEPDAPKNTVAQFGVDLDVATLVDEDVAQAFLKHFMDHIKNNSDARNLPLKKKQIDNFFRSFVQGQYGVYLKSTGVRKDIT